MKPLALAALVFACLLFAVRAQSPLPPWVSVVAAQDCSAGCWRVVSVEYLDEVQSAGLHHLFARTLDVQGNQIVGKMNIAWDGGSTWAQTKPPPDFGDIPLWACFRANEGEVGGYKGFAGEWEANSDVVRGMGLPYCAHVSYRITWRWDNGGVTPTPTDTATPTAEWGHRLYVPIIRR